MENIRVYIYTAVNGYAWQGCGTSISSSLMSCVDSLGLFDSPGGAEPPLGAVVRWKVAGENGTAVLRAHIRKAGDFRGRDSRYIALAFLPFRITRAHPADYRRLWNHPLLAATHQDPLDGLAMDYTPEFWLSPGEESGGGFWTEDVSRTCPPNGGDGVLHDLSIMFQSSATELGALSAVIRGDSSEGLSARLSYKAFSEVSEEARASKAYMEVQEGAGQIGAATSLRSAWRKALDGLSDRAGRMPDFGGLADYARREERAFSNTEAGFAETRDFASGAEALLKSCTALRGTIDGSVTQETAIREHESRNRHLSDKVRSAACSGRDEILHRLEEAERLLARARNIHAEAARFAESARRQFSDDADCAFRCRQAFRALRAMPDADWLSSEWLESWDGEIRRVEERAREQARGNAGPASVRHAKASSAGGDRTTADGDSRNDGRKRRRSRASRIVDWVFRGLIILIVLIAVTICVMVFFSSKDATKDATPSEKDGGPLSFRVEKLPENVRFFECPTCQGRGKRVFTCSTCSGCGRLEIVEVVVRPARDDSKSDDSGSGKAVEETSGLASTNKTNAVGGKMTRKNQRQEVGTVAAPTNLSQKADTTMPTNLSRQVSATMPTNLFRQADTTMPTNLSRQAGATMPTNLLRQVSATMPTNLLRQVSATMPTNQLQQVGATGSQTNQLPQRGAKHGRR